MKTDKNKDKKSQDLSKRKELLESFVERVEKANVDDDEIFVRLLLEGMQLTGISDRDIAHQRGVSRPTVRRWKKGISAPHPKMRRSFYEFLRKSVEKLLEK